MLLTFSNIHAISETQIKTAKAVKKEAKKYTKWYMEVVGICGTETSYGIDRENNEETYGLMQINPDTARWIASKWSHLKYLCRMSDYQIENILVRNDRLSIELASRLLDYLIKHNGRNTGIRRYNGINNYRYLYTVNKNTKLIKKIIKGK